MSIFYTEERLGILAIARIFVRDFNLVFREQFVNDFGIDGFLSLGL